MGGDDQEAGLARGAALAAAASRAGLATASFVLAAAARAAFAMAVVVLVAVAVICGGGAAGAADLPQPPAPTNTLPGALPAPPVTAPKVVVPPLTVPDATVPSISVTVTAPPLNLRPPVPSGSPAGAPAVVAPSGAGSVQTTAASRATSSEPGSKPGSTVGAAGAGGTVGERSRIRAAARQTDPATRGLAFRLGRAAADTAAQLTFPIGLALAMLAFLVFQHQVDKNDPRVTAPKETGDDDLLRFS